MLGFNYKSVYSKYRPFIINKLIRSIEVYMTDIIKKKEYISRITNDKDISEQLTKENFVEIGNMVKRVGLGDMIKYQQDGCRVNLDLIHNDGLINQIYNYIKYKKKEV